MSIAMIALVSRNASTVECLGAWVWATGYKELKNAMEAVIEYMLAKTTLSCTNCEKRIASACSWNRISIQLWPLSELLTLARSSPIKECAFASTMSVLLKCQTSCFNRSKCMTVSTTVESSIISVVKEMLSALFCDSSSSLQLWCSVFDFEWYEVSMPPDILCYL